VVEIIDACQFRQHVEPAFLFQTLEQLKKPARRHDNAVVVPEFGRRETVRAKASLQKAQNGLIIHGLARFGRPSSGRGALGPSRSRLELAKSPGATTAWLGSSRVARGRGASGKRRSSNSLPMNVPVLRIFS